jgi:hypothetical protein
MYSVYVPVLLSTCSSMNPPFPIHPLLVSVVPSGLRMERATVQLLNDELVVVTLTCCRATPSNTNRPTCPAVEIVAVVLPPSAMFPVKPTLATELGGGGTKKYPLVAVCPYAVPTVMCPEAVLLGTVVASVVVVAEVRDTNDVFNFTRSFAEVGSKLVPLIVTAVPATPMVGVKLVIVGVPGLAATVKGVLLVADPLGVATLMVPVVAPGGTVTFSCVGEAEETVAAVPLKATVS